MLTKKDAKNQLNALKDHYKMEIDWMGRLFSDITLKETTEIVAWTFWWNNHI